MRKHGRHVRGHVYGADQDRVPQGSSRELTTAQARRALTTIGEVVYAIRCPDGVIKIGHTTQLQARCYQVGGELLAFMFGSYDDEQSLHARLAGHLHHGREWYYPTPGVMAVVNEMREAFGLAPVA